MTKFMAFLEFDATLSNLDADSSRIILTIGVIVLLAFGSLF